MEGIECVSIVCRYWGSKNQKEEFQVANFFSCLNSEYVEVKHSIFTSEKLPSFNNVYAHRQHIDTQFFSSGNGIKDTSALASIGQSRGGPPIWVQGWG